MELPEGTSWGRGVDFDYDKCYTCKKPADRIYITSHHNSFPMCNVHYCYWIKRAIERLWPDICQKY